MSFPDDWPEDKRTGPGFLQELMKRHPNQVQIGSLQQGIKWLEKEPPEKPKSEP
jgi:hypothetical protein